MGAKVSAVEVLEKATGGYNEQARAVTINGNLPALEGHFEADVKDGAAVEDHVSDPEDDGDNDDHAGGEGEVAADQPPAEITFTRRQVETFVRAAGTAGYEIGETRMFQGEPEPVIRWSDDNVPEIAHWTATKPSTAAVDRDHGGVASRRR
jgi:hypothetical protein